MKALRIQNSQLNVADIPVPEHGDEALVRIIRSGVCGTDLELVRGYSGFSGTPGHEFVGVVETADLRPELIGKRVVGEINAGCGECDLCLGGDSRHCPTRTVLGIVGRDGAHAEYLTLPARNLYEVPPNVSDDAAVFVEPLAAAIGIGERCDFQPHDRVAVVGDGKLGILCARGLSILPMIGSLILIGKNDQKLSLGAKSGIETEKVDQVGNFKTHFDVVVEASGSESGFETAMQIVKPRGRVILKSTYHGVTKWDASRLVVNEVTVIGSRCGRFEPAVQLLASNQIEVLDLISEEFSLSNSVAAFEQAGRKGVLKVLINASNN